GHSSCSRIPLSHVRTCGHPSRLSAVARSAEADSLPCSHGAAHRNDLPEVIAIVIGKHENAAEVRLVDFACWHERIEIFRLARELLELLALTFERGHRLVPCMT